ncbi:hypothetical protein Bhyg_17218 [Pseudolycoriella hygida]|uniref:MAD2L1-binding protein n=1 Tax=Pseudolycoriella hygida TaxID=35572 RepID=A0A9Q0MK08_9DIPT|nr:hypothetical protein Bhyg_17218 [Pseudolycoriella hygida]
MCSKYTSIDVPFNTPVITSKAAGIILRSVIEFLAFYKKQIPFPYDTFKLMTNKIQKQVSEEDFSDDLLHMQIERHKLLAINTFNDLRNLLENVTNQLDQIECNQALVLFGATSQTPKEAFLINIPPITKYHHAVNHQDSITRIAKSITMSILTSSKFYEIDSKLNTTNMFVLLNSKVKPSNMCEDRFQLYEDFRLPRSCKTVVLNLRNTSPPTKMNCCEHLVVYDDLLNDSLNVVDKQMASMEINCDKSDDVTDDITGMGWHGSTVFVRGFKDVLVKGKSIWNC